MIDTIQRADAENAALVVFTLRTPGGLVDATRDIVTKMIAAKTPIAVYVAPSGARAASAGFIITIAADIAAMAPGTHIGAAHPVAGGGVGDGRDELEESGGRHGGVCAHDCRRARPQRTAGRAGRSSRAKPSPKKRRLKATPPLIDFVATSVDDLLKKLDGRAVRRFDGSSATLRTASAARRADRDDAAAAHPQRDCPSQHRVHPAESRHARIDDRVVEPRCGTPRVVGGLSLLLAFFALQVLPVNYRGRAADALRPAAACARDQGDELRAADRRRHHQPDLRIADADRLSGARASAQPDAGRCRSFWVSRRSRRFSCGLRWRRSAPRR